MTIPTEIPTLDDCSFYHAMDLPGFGVQAAENSWDLRGRFPDYTAHVALGGKTFLDVGTASGFLSFEAERRGAAVTSFDAETPAQWQFMRDPAEADIPRQFRMLRNSYVLAHHCYQSRAHLATGDIYDLSARVVPHDIVLVGQILVHLRDPLAALHQVSRVARERMIITEGSFASDAPTAVFLGDGVNDYYSWWHLSENLYRKYLPILGFEIESVTTGEYRCNAPSLRGDVKLWTFVARRV